MGFSEEFCFDEKIVVEINNNEGGVLMVVAVVVVLGWENGGDWVGLERGWERRI